MFSKKKKKIIFIIIQKKKLQKRKEIKKNDKGILIGLIFWIRLLIPLITLLLL